jgi:hypothetical protein
MSVYQGLLVESLMVVGEGWEAAECFYNEAKAAFVAGELTGLEFVTLIKGLVVS